MPIKKNDDVDSNDFHAEGWVGELGTFDWERNNTLYAGMTAPPVRSETEKPRRVTVHNVQRYSFAAARDFLSIAADKTADEKIARGATDALQGSDRFSIDMHVDVSRVRTLYYYIVIYVCDSIKTTTGERKKRKVKKKKK